MTIKIERDSQLRVSDSHSDSSTSHVPPFETGIVEDDFLLVNFPQMCSSVGKLRSSTLDDDTASTGSFSSDSTDSSTDAGLRRVSFANDLVTDAWTRPYTPRSEVSSLFYSTEETTRFRQEYRLERKLLSELSVDPTSISLDDKDLSALVSPSSPQQPFRISRVVVLHNDKLETFMDEANADDSFDNDSFWSGSITWY